MCELCYLINEKQTSRLNENRAEDAENKLKQASHWVMSSTIDTTLVEFYYLFQITDKTGYVSAT